MIWVNKHGVYLKGKSANILYYSWKGIPAKKWYEITGSHCAFSFLFFCKKFLQPVFKKIDTLKVLK
jgi:hypothetical protein